MYDLCVSLLQAKNEKEVENIIYNNSNIFQQNNWFPVDGKDNNFGQIDAQGKNPERALVEKITNSIDAVLLKECKSRGLNPTSPEAPKTINQALELFFEIEQGDLSSITEEKRDLLASMIYVIAEDFNTKKANFYFIDKGDGQNPENFKDTFLKIGGNKASTYFVHGRFGTGSFGVLPNCGDNKYQLIISRAYSKDKDYNVWGWTLIRKNRSKDLRTRHAWYEYFNINGSVPTFSLSDLSTIIKKCVGYDKLDISDFEYGTIIKLFNYDLPTSSDVDRDLNRVVNRYLFSPALPFRILDAQTKAHVGPGKEVDGNLNRLRKNKIELEGNEKLQIQRVKLPKLGEVNIDIYIAKRKSGKKSFIESERISTNAETVFFIRNGQSHGELPRQFIRDDIGLEYIAKDIAVYIDCSETPPVDFDDVFPPTRDSMRENRHRNSVESAIRNELKNHEGLKLINARRRSEVITENIEKTKDIEGFVNDLFNLDPAFRMLLSGPIQISDTSSRGNEIESEYKGKYFPTFLTIKDKEIKNKGLKSIPVNSFVKVIFETDAQNDYLFRDAEKGDLHFEYKGSVGSFKLYNGRLTIKIFPPKLENIIGLEDRFKVMLTRPHDEPLTFDFKVRYAPKINTRTNPPPPPPPPLSNKLVLPAFSSLPMKDWQNLGMDENSLCEVSVEKDEFKNVYVLKEVILNADFPSFEKYLKSQNLSPRKVKEMKEQFQQAIYISAISVHKDYAIDHSYNKEVVRAIMTQIGKSLPFVLFTMQKKWLKELQSNE